MFFQELPAMQFDRMSCVGENPEMANTNSSGVLWFALTPLPHEIELCVYGIALPEHLSRCRMEEKAEGGDLKPEGRGDVSHRA